MTSQRFHATSARPWLGTAFGVAVASSWLLQGEARAQDGNDPGRNDPGHTDPAQTADPAQETAAKPLETVTVLGVRDDYLQRAPHLDRIVTGLVDTPQTMSEIPRALLDDQNTTSVLDALKTIPGISIAAGEGAQQGDNLSIRGFNAQNDFYRDGMLDFGSATRDPFDIESIEVLKGPSATLFGRGSTGGVINQVTKAARMAPVTAATLSFGTDGTERATLDLDRSNAALGGSAARLNLMVNRNGLAGIDEARQRRYGVAPSIAFGLDGSTRLRIDYVLQQSDDTQYYGIPWLNGRPAAVARSNFYGYPSDYLRSTVQIGTVRLEHDFSSTLTVHNQIRYSAYDVAQRAVEPEFLGYSPSTDIVPDSIPLSALQISRNVLALSGSSSLFDNQTEAQAAFSTGPIRHAVVLGLEEQRQTADITRTTYPHSLTGLLAPDLSAPFPYAGSLRSISGTVSNDVAPYGNDTISLGTRWQLLGGWRWDRYTTEYHQIVAPQSDVTRSDDTPSWRGAIVYKPTDTSSIYFNYGTSFDPSGEAIGLTAATAALPPETSTTDEVGTKWEIGRLSLTGALYQIQMANVRETDPNDATKQILAGNYRARGFELSAAGHLTRNWEVFGGYSYNDVVVVSSPNQLEIGNSPPNAPKHTIALWSEYHIPATRIELGAGVNFITSRTASSLPVAGTTIIERAPGNTTLQLMAKYRINRSLTAQVNLTNATDVTTYSALHPTHIVLGPARAALFSISADL